MFFKTWGAILYNNDTYGKQKLGIHSILSQNSSLDGGEVLNDPLIF
jgi:hypothetical protein